LHTAAVNLFRFAKLCLRMLGASRPLAGTRFDSNASVASTHWLAIIRDALFGIRDVLDRELFSTDYMLPLPALVCPHWHQSFLK